MKNTVKITSGWILGFMFHYALLISLYIINERFPAWKCGTAAVLCFIADFLLVLLVYKLEDKFAQKRPARVFLIVNLLIWAFLLIGFSYLFLSARMSELVF